MAPRFATDQGLLLKIIDTSVAELIQLQRVIPITTSSIRGVMWAESGRDISCRRVCARTCNCEECVGPKEENS